MGMLALSPTNLLCVGHKIYQLLKGRRTPRTITDATGLATAHPQQRRVFTTYVAVAPGPPGFSCVVSSVLARSTALAIKQANGLATDQEQQARVSATLFAAAPN